MYGESQVKEGVRPRVLGSPNAGRQFLSRFGLPFICPHNRYQITKEEHTSRKCSME